MTTLWNRISMSVGLAMVLVSVSAQAGLPIQRWTAANQAEVLLIESPALPMVDVQIDFDAGSRRDPPRQAGLASAVAAMMSKGVQARDAAAALDENALGEAWADLGAMFGASAGSDRFSVTLRSLTVPDVLQGALQLAARQLADPTFPPEVWNTERDRFIAALKEANSQPGTQAQRAFSRAVYGQHPYGFKPDEASVQAISTTDLRQFHAHYLKPCRARVSLVGALNRAQAEAAVERLLAWLPQGGSCDALPAVADVEPLTAAAEHKLSLSSAQAHVLIGQPGIRRADPAFFPVTVGNYILGGGGFVSRLTEQVREKRGLSYSVYSYFAPGLHAGAFTVGLQTRPDQATQAVQVATDVLRQFVQEGPTEQELQAAKDNLIGGFALRLDSNRKLLDQLANIAWNRLPLTYLDTWTDEVQRVTVADIRAAFQRVLQPDRMVTVIVGGQP
jgi:zinc protease